MRFSAKNGEKAVILQGESGFDIGDNFFNFFQRGWFPERYILDVIMQFL